MAKYVELAASGELDEVRATVISTGASEAGDLPALDAAGKLDESLMPAGIVADVKVGTTTEALVAGNYVNIFNNGGGVGIRKADATNNRRAMGFVKESYGSGIATAKIFFEGPNTAVNGTQTIGLTCFLGAAGAVTQTPPTAPTFSISQQLGQAMGANEVNTELSRPIGIIV